MRINVRSCFTRLSLCSCNHDDDDDDDDEIVFPLLGSRHEGNPEENSMGEMKELSLPCRVS
jgi:hypothetical protein